MGQGNLTDDWENSDALPVENGDRASQSLRSPQFQEPDPEPDVVDQASTAAAATPDTAPRAPKPMGTVGDLVPQWQFPDNYAPRSEKAADYAKDKANFEDDRQRQERQKVNDVNHSDAYQSAEDGRWKKRIADPMTGAMSEVDVLDARMAKTDGKTGEIYMDGAMGRQTIGKDDGVAERARLLEERRQLRLGNNVAGSQMAELKAKLGPLGEELKAFGKTPEALSQVVSRLEKGINPANPDPGAMRNLERAKAQLAAWHATNPDYSKRKQAFDELSGQSKHLEEVTRETNRRIITSLVADDYIRRTGKLPPAEKPAPLPKEPVANAAAIEQEQAPKSTAPAPETGFWETATPWLSSVGNSFMAGVASLGSGVLGTAAAIQAKATGKPLEDSEVFQLSNEISDYWRRRVDPKAAGPVATNLASGIGSAMTFLAPGGIAAKAFGTASKVGKVAQIAVPAVLGMVVNGGNALNEAKEKGYTDEEALKSFGFNFGMGATEAIGLGRIFTRLDKITGGSFRKYIGSLARETLGNAVEEGIQEAVQTAGSDLFDKINKLGSGANKEWSAIWKDAAESGLYGAAVGALFGGLMGGAMRLEQRKAALAQQAFPQQYVNLHGAVEELRGKAEADPSLAEGVKQAENALQGASARTLTAVPENARKVLAKIVAPDLDPAVLDNPDESSDSHFAAIELGRSVRGAYVDAGREQRIGAVVRDTTDLPIAAQVAVDRYVAAAASRDLGRIASGTVIEGPKAQALEDAGLVQGTADASGAITYAITDDALPLLPANIRKAVAASPERFKIVTTPGTPGNLFRNLAVSGQRYVAQTMAGTLRANAAKANAPEATSPTAQAAPVQATPQTGAGAGIDLAGPSSAPVTSAIPASSQAPDRQPAKGTPETSGAKEGEGSSLASKGAQTFRVNVESELPGGAGTAVDTVTVEATSEAQALAKARGQAAKGGRKVTSATIDQPAKPAEPVADERAAEPQAEPETETVSESGTAGERVSELGARPEQSWPEITRSNAGRLTDALSGRGVRFEITGDGQTLASPAADGSVTINFNPARASSRENGLAALWEELDHAAAMVVKRGEWEAAGKPDTFTLWLRDDAYDLYDELRATWARLPESAEKAGIGRAMVASYNTYHARYEEGANLTEPQDVLDTLQRNQGDDFDGYGFLYEFARQVGQLQKRGTITEATLPEFRTFWQKVGNWLRAAFDELKTFAEALRRADHPLAKTGFADLIAKKQAVLDDLEALLAAPVVESARDTTPVVESETPKAEAQTITLDGEAVPVGGEWQSGNPRGKEVVSGKWAVVPIRLLGINKQVGEGQNRIDRERTGAAQRAEIIGNMTEANIPLKWGDSPTLNDGAPIIRPDGSIEAGNNRTMALRDLYRAGNETKAKAYRTWVEQRANALGLSTVPFTGEPIALVRVLEDMGGLDRQELVEAANTPGVMATTEAEDAISDARALDLDPLMDALDPNEDGGLNREFLSQFARMIGSPETLRMADGGLNFGAIEKRARAAMLARLLEGAPAFDRVLTQLLEDAEGMKRTLGGVFRALPGLLRIQRLNPSLGIVRELGRALGALPDYREQKARGRVKLLGDYLAQKDLFESPLEGKLMQFLVDAKSGAEIAENLNAYVAQVASYGDPNQEQMFAAPAPDRGTLGGKLPTREALTPKERARLLVLQGKASRGETLRFSEQWERETLERKGGQGFFDFAEEESPFRLDREEAASQLRTAINNAEQMALFTRGVDPRIERAMQNRMAKGGKPIVLDEAWGLPAAVAVGKKAEPTARVVDGKYLQGARSAVISDEIVLNDDGDRGANPLAQFLPTNQEISREQLHEAIVRWYVSLARLARTDQGQVLFTGGGPAAGKSTFIRGMEAEGKIPGKEQRLTLSADDIKLLLPEMQSLMADGDPFAASAVHVESQRVFNAVVEELLRQPFKMWLVWDATLSRPAEMLPIMARFKAAGYERHLRGILIDPWEAAVRSAARYVETSRYVPVGGVANGHKGFQANFRAYLPSVDTYEVRGIMFGDSVYSAGGENLRQITVESNVKPVDPEAREQYRLAGERSKLNDQARNRDEFFDSYAPEHPARVAGSGSGYAQAEAAQADAAGRGTGEGERQAGGTADRERGALAARAPKKRSVDDGTMDLFAQPAVKAAAQAYVAALPAKADVKAEAEKDDLGAWAGELFAFAAQQQSQPKPTTKGGDSNERDQEEGQQGRRQEVLSPAQSPVVPAGAWETPAGAATVEERKAEAADKVADQILDKLNRGEALDWRELFESYGTALGGSQANGDFTPKDAYDALELAINRYILHPDNRGAFNPERMEGFEAQTSAAALRAITRLKSLLQQVPTQTKRTAETDEFQQFSTVPPLAFVANWVAAPTSADTVLEPSAGIGGLAVFSKNAGAKIELNELSPRRAAILRKLGIGRVFMENAEQINNILPADVRPTLVVMNPPFSSTAGRMSGTRDTANATKHIEQALARLPQGGRLVAIVGEGMAMDRPAFRGWWRQMQAKYHVRANVGVNGAEYTKYGTSFDNQLFVIDKVAPPKTGGNVAALRKEREQTRIKAMGLSLSVEDLRVNSADAANAVQKEADALWKKVDELDAQILSAEPPAPITGKVDKVEDLVDLLAPIAYSRPQVSNDSRGSNPVSSQRPGSGVAGNPERPVGANPGRNDAATDASGVGGGASPQQSGVGGPDKAGGNAGSGSGDAAGLGGRSDAGQGQAGSGGTVGTGVAPGFVAARASEASEDAIFDQYTPRITYPGTTMPPVEVQESAAMAAIDPIKPTYTPALGAEYYQPQGSKTEGRLSALAMESITLAGNSHQEMVPAAFTEDEKRAWKDQYKSEPPTEFRRASFIGDGTGMGKGRQVFGIILDNWLQGRKRAVWMSEKPDLFNDAKRDASDVAPGMEKQIFEVGKMKAAAKIDRKEGIAFMSYSTLRSEAQAKDSKEEPRTRVDQIVEWLGADFDGVIAFDEAHNMGNAIAMKGKRGMTQPSKQALAGLELQRRLPKARVVYISATGATEVANLSYAERLGLWGAGTPFANIREFVSHVASRGTAAMELVAQNLKSLGLYVARSISWRGIQYRTLDHRLSGEQRENYDTMARAWQLVLSRMDEALKVIGAVEVNPETGAETTKNKDMKSKVRSKFWGAHQRFFNQIITSMKMPTVLQAVEEEVKAGNAVVLQLVNTNEAAQERAIAKKRAAAAESEEAPDFEDLDMTPRDILMQMVEASFPVQMQETFTDADGNEGVRTVKDSNGNPVLNPEAVAMRDALLDELGAIKVPDGPLEMLFNHFGSDAVAEVTGRGQRIEWVKEKDGTRVKKPVKRGKGSNEREIDDFKKDKKQILVFSAAGGTGRSYHADRNIPNQRKRIHVLLQPGWRADAAIQGMGRTHRNNQKQPPEYILATSDVLGEKRFISSIARRLDQLGALTKGQRQTASQGIFKAGDNLESEEAKEALRSFYTDVMAGRVQGLGADVLEKEMGLKLRDKDGAPLDTLPPITQFLNRLLSLTLETQGKVFDAFRERLDLIVEQKTRAGTIDSGVEAITALSAKIIDEKVIATDARSGAPAKYTKVELTKENKLRAYPTNATEFVQNIRSGRIYSVSAKTTTTDTTTGALVEEAKLLGVQGAKWEPVRNLGKAELWKRIPVDEAEAFWEKGTKEAEPTYTEVVHLLTGTLLPVWDRFAKDVNVQLKKVRVEGGKTLIGVPVGASTLPYVMRNFGITETGEKPTTAQAADALRAGNSIRLANNWRVKRVRLSGEQRFEMVGPSRSNMGELQSFGVFTERVAFDTRFFIPADRLEDVLGKLEKSGKAVVEVQTLKSNMLTRAPGAGQLSLPLTEVDRAAAKADAEPSDAQKEAGNYRKGHTSIAGLPITIENEAGSERRGTDANGKAWSVTMATHYGYLKRTEGKDGDQVDALIKAGTPRDWNGTVFVVNQLKANGQFDEHKAVFGADTLAEASALYHANYSEGWKGWGGASEMPMDDFKRWLAGEETAKPAPLEPGEKNVGKLIRENMGLAVTIANSYGNIKTPMDDIVSEARIGLVEAAKAHDPRKGPFTAYAATIIRNRLNKLFQKAGTYAFRNETTLDAPLPGSEDETGTDMLSRNGSEEVVAPIERADTTSELQRAFSALTAEQRRVIEGQLAGKTLEAIGAEMGITKQGAKGLSLRATARLREFMQARGLRGVDADGVLYTRPDPVASATAEVHQKQIDQEATRTLNASEAEPPPEVMTTWRDAYAAHLQGRYDKLAHFAPGTDDTLLDLERRNALVSAALREFNERIDKSVQGSFGNPTFWKSPAARKRLKAFKAKLLPVASRLNATGYDADGNFTFEFFYQRAGTLSEAQAREKGVSTGDYIDSGRGDKLRVGKRIFTRRDGTELTEAEARTAITRGQNVTTFYQIERPMGTEVQRQIHEAFHQEFPEAAHWLDSFIAPGRDSARVIDARGIRLPDFNRYSLADFYSESPYGEIARIAGYTPDVTRAKSLAGMVGSLLSFDWISDARKRKTGEARERGEVRDLFEGWNVRAMEAHEESIRRDTAESLLKVAVKTAPEGDVPPGWRRLDRELFNPLLRAMRSAQGLTIEQLPGLEESSDPTLQDKINAANLETLRRLVGDPALFNPRKMVRQEVVDEILRGFAVTRINNRFLNIIDGLTKRMTAGYLAHPFTWLQNIASNEIFKTMRALQRASYGVLRHVAGEHREGRVAMREAANLVSGLVTDRWFNTKQREVMDAVAPLELFERNNGLRAVLGEDLSDKIGENLRAANVPGAILAAARYGKMDGRAKQQLVFAAYQAHAAEALSEHEKSAGKITGKAARQAWMRQWIAKQPNDFHRNVRAAAVTYALDYMNVPWWLDEGTRMEVKGMDVTPIANMVRRLVIPFGKYPYAYARQIKRLGIDSVLDVTVRRKFTTKAERANAFANLGMLAILMGVARAALGGDDDEGFSKIGSAYDEEGKVLESAFNTGSRVNITDTALGSIVRAVARMGGETDADAQDYWLRVRTVPYGNVALLLSALETSIRAMGGEAKPGVRENLGDNVQSMLEDFVSTGLGLHLLIRAAGYSNKYEQNIPTPVLLGQAAVDMGTSGVVPSAIARPLVNIADPLARRVTPSKSLEYDPGFLEGVASKVPGVSRVLPPAGRVVPRISPDNPKAVEARATLEAAGVGDSYRENVDEKGNVIASYPDPNTLHKHRTWTELLRGVGLNVKPIDREKYKDEVRGLGPFKM